MGITSVFVVTGYILDVAGKMSSVLRFAQDEDVRSDESLRSGFSYGEDLICFYVS